MMRVIDVSKKRKFKMLEVTCDINCDIKKSGDYFPFNHSVEWLGKVYMLGRDHIHMITKDGKKHDFIENYG